MSALTNNQTLRASQPEVTLSAKHVHNCTEFFKKIVSLM